MHPFKNNPEHQKTLINSAVEQFPPDIKAVNFILNQVQKAHLGCDFVLNGDLVVNHGFELVKNIPILELNEDQGISIFYLLTSYLHKRHFNFMSTVNSSIRHFEPELTHVSPNWNEELDARLLTKPDVAKEIIQTMEDYRSCNSSQTITDSLNYWKNIADKSKVIFENDIFIIRDKE